MTELFTHPDCLAHETPAGHPERPARLGAVLDRLEADGLLGELTCRTPSPAGDDALARVHDRRYIDALARVAPKEGLLRVETDTVMSPGSLQAARLAAGAVSEAVDRVLDGAARRAFGQSRKQLANALGSPAGISAALETRGIDPKRRPETLSLEEWDVVVEALACLPTTAATASLAT